MFFFNSNRRGGDESFWRNLLTSMLFPPVQERVKGEFWRRSDGGNRRRLDGRSADPAERATTTTNGPTVTEEGETQTAAISWFPDYSTSLPPSSPRFAGNSHVPATWGRGGRGIGRRGARWPPLSRFPPSFASCGTRLTILPRINR